MTTSTQKGFAASCERNQQFILEQLQPRLENASSLLEIGSGTGQHAVFLAKHLPQLTWQPSERNHLRDIELYRQESGLNNIKPAIILDINRGFPSNTFDAVFTANTLHIIAEELVVKLFEKLPKVLKHGGLFFAYGPFKENGEFSSASNAEFEQWLKGRDPLSGIRDLELLTELAEKNSLQLKENIAMPANNQILVFEKI